MLPETKILSLLGALFVMSLGTAEQQMSCLFATGW